jgi:D-serine deaminase-like pyridoxal phosphate-dependent protein
MVESAGLEVEIVSGGSTGTYDIDTEVVGLTELQAGSYTVMDLEYRSIGGRDSDRFGDFAMALTVLTTVVSVADGDRAIVDAGVKALATDTPFTPEVVDHRELTYVWAGDEHGRLFPDAGRPLPRLGETLRLYPPHCDPTVNLYDRLYLVEGDEVVATWAIAARGPC